jgi:hypothetical protein
MKRILLAGLALGLSAPSLAQPASTPVSATQTLDPQRLALAQTAVDAVWPLGTYGRILDGTMNGMMDQMMSSMLDMKASDVAGGAVPARSGEKSMREELARADPHFEERTRIMNRVMFEEMRPILSRIEPGIRTALVRVYARKFTAPELAEMNRFFATETGRKFGSEVMVSWADPELTAAMARMMPEMMQAMPAIMKKAQAATAHLPPPKAQARGRAPRS